MSGEPSFDTSEFLIKREVPDEPPQMSEDLVDLDQHSRDYNFPAVVKVFKLYIKEIEFSFVKNIFESGVP